MSRGLSDTSKLARTITRSSSFQTFNTIQLLADRGRTADAHRAYAYFRWVDDCLDRGELGPVERADFVARQRALVESCLMGRAPLDATPQEGMLVDLLQNDPNEHSPLGSYVHNMLAVMSFDAGRKGRLITKSELVAYQSWLSIAVTEAMHYFIGHDKSAPQTSERYLAVTAAHITHMLRDTHEDLQAGYFNIPVEFLRAHGITAYDVDSAGYKAWAQMRVAEARRCFRAGRRYLRQVACRRCRLAAYAYTARFEGVLDLIEGDGFVLRADYSGTRTLEAGFKMIGSILASFLGMDALAPASRDAAPDRSGGSP